MFGKLGTGELILILAVALVVVGPGKLPDIGKALGKSINEFKKFSSGVQEDLTISLDDNKPVKKVDKKETIEETLAKDEDKKEEDSED